MRLQAAPCTGAPPDMTVHARVFANSYRDSVELMQIAVSLEAVEGIERAGLVMATPANRDVLARAGLLTDAASDAGPNDLVVAVAATDAAAATAAFELAAGSLAGHGLQDGGGEVVRTQARTIAEAVAALPGASIALISTPGSYAAAEAMKALKRGLHVFLFSDNVTIDEEIELKALGRRSGLMVMGPDCGTAILDGVPLGFANVVRRGRIGLVAASGTGLQQVSVLIDRDGAGVSQAIGVGGRDLHERVGGAMMLDGLARLAADPGTDVIVLISKPPSDAVAEVVLRAAATAGKPVVVNFLGGDATRIAEGGAVPAGTFEAAASVAVALSRGQGVPGDTGIGDVRLDPDLRDAAATAASGLDDGRVLVRGLYSGGSLAGEAKLIIRAALGDGAVDTVRILDLGDDEYTVGRPHPMIDPRLRTEMLHEALRDPATAVVLLDVVLGHGASADPAGPLAAAIAEARRGPGASGLQVAVVASVCGTTSDPQGLAAQEAALARVGVIVAASNAKAARAAALIVESRLAPATQPTGRA